MLIEDTIDGRLFQGYFHAVFFSSLGVAVVSGFLALSDAVYGIVFPSVPIPASDSEFAMRSRSLQVPGAALGLVLVILVRSSTTGANECLRALGFGSAKMSRGSAC